MQGSSDASPGARALSPRDNRWMAPGMVPSIVIVIVGQWKLTKVLYFGHGAAGNLLERRQPSGLREKAPTIKQAQVLFI